MKNIKQKRSLHRKITEMEFCFDIAGIMIERHDNRFRIKTDFESIITYAE